MKIDKRAFPFHLSKEFIAILESEISKAHLPPETGVILNFRDPDYSPESGGFHPVEIYINAKGQIQYITDFSYVGRPPFAELAKEIDFDVSMGLFQHLGRDLPIDSGRELFTLWARNFCRYFQMGAYEVTAEPS